MNSEEKLLDAVYEKLKRGEPPSIHDMDRWINFLASAPMPNISQPSEQDVATINNKLVNVLQQRFMNTKPAKQ